MKKDDEEKSTPWMVLQRALEAENGEAKKRWKMVLELRTEKNFSFRLRRERP